VPELFETGDGWLAARILFLVPVVLSLTVHEFAHAWTAWKLGDDTAAREGRLTLNPLEHIDPVGLLLPLLGVPFGWAKPVPINPGRFSRSVSMETGLVLTASAGPISNILLAIAATCAMALWTRFDPGAPTTGSGVWAMLETLVFLNLLLAFFNLLPIPPLDGSRIADGLMPDALRPAWDAFASLGPMTLIAVILVPAFLGFSLFNAPLALARTLLDGAFALLAS
jgi:Zn-dependent protease